MSDPTLPTDSAARKDVPLARGCLDYFPAALAEVARLSLAGNQKHNPGEELHHARGKSSDHRDCIMRHLTECDTIDTDGFLHDVKVAWRALANLQEALERRGAPLARGARSAEVKSPERCEDGFRCKHGGCKFDHSVAPAPKLSILPDLSCNDIPLRLCEEKYPEDGGYEMCAGCPAGIASENMPVPGLREFFYPEAQS